MGILVTKREDEWIIGLRETWIVPSEDRGEFERFLEEKKINYKWKKVKGRFAYHFNDIECHLREEELMTTLVYIIQYKKNFGNIKQKVRRLNVDAER